VANTPCGSQTDQAQAEQEQRTRFREALRFDLHIDIAGLVPAVAERGECAVKRQRAAVVEEGAVLVVRAGRG
jgi:hypothetical protein